MSDSLIGIVIAQSILGLILVLGGVLSLGGWLPLNGIVGIRTASTMKSKAAWKAGHRAASPYLFAGGLCAFAGDVFAFVAPETNELVLGLVPTAAVVLTLVAAALVASRSAMRIPFEES